MESYALASNKSDSQMMELETINDRNKRWELLKQDGKFNQEIADRVTIRLSDKIKISGKTIESLYRSLPILPTISQEIKYNGEKLTKLNLKTVLEPILSLCTGKNAFEKNKQAYDHLCDMILEDEEYASFRLPEFGIMIDMAIRGKFGIIYDRVDSAVVFQWLQEYSKRSYEHIKQERQKEYDKQKREESKMSKENASILANMFKEVNEKRGIYVHDPESKDYKSIGELMSANPIVGEYYKNQYELLSKSDKDELKNSRGIKNADEYANVCAMKYMKKK